MRPHRPLRVQHVIDEDYCGSCYGAADSGVCCNTCDEVKNAYRKKGWSFEGQGRGIAQCLRDDYIEDLNEQAEQAEGCNLHGERPTTTNFSSERATDKAAGSCGTRCEAAHSARAWQPRTGGAS